MFPRSGKFQGHRIRRGFAGFRRDLPAPCSQDLCKFLSKAFSQKFLTSRRVLERLPASALSVLRFYVYVSRLRTRC